MKSEFKKALYCKSLEKYKLAFLSEKVVLYDDDEIHRFDQALVKFFKSRMFSKFEEVLIPVPNRSLIILPLRTKLL